jgi:aryl-alcohol dehydrogenase-like predicted oxidoreductase
MHCPPTEVYSHDLTYEMLDNLVAKGKIQHYGFSVQTVEEAIACIQRPHTKSVQIIFNMLRLKPAEEFFKMAKEKNIAIIVRVPLASGLLTGKMNTNSSFPENDHRNYNIKGDAFDVGETFSGVDFNKALTVVEELKSLTPEGFSLSQLALKWILMHEAVSVIIPGAKNSDQVLKNISASSLPDIHNLMQKIEDIYNTYLKADIHPRW